ncbi:MAG: FAD-dependent oxidoreductase [Actinomycetota bacterium]
MSETAAERAVVLGGSMAGLLATRVLAERYREVVLVDRDDLTLDNADRRGVPQAAHAHVLLARGRQALEELFPGLTGELIADGAPHGDMLGEARVHFSGHRLRRGTAGLRMLSVSRPFLESHVRARVRVLPNVSVAPPSDIVGLATSPDGGYVTGATVFPRADGSTADVIDADLVVDATGRGSRTPRWLEDLGYARPAEERVDIDVGYATAIYRMAPDALDGDWGTLQAPTPGLPRGGSLARLEGGDRWMLTLMGMTGDHPPTDPEGFTAFAGSLRFPDITDAIRDAEPARGPVAYRFPANVRRRYERLDGYPKGLLVVGDGVCSFNPIYGQGMTVAALEALTLRTHLERHATPRPRRFQREIARVVDVPWEMAIGGDLSFPGTRGDRTRKRRVLASYMSRLHAAAAHDASLAAAFLRVSCLVDPPTALLRPAVVARVLGPTKRSGDESGRQSADYSPDHRKPTY